MRVDAQFIGMDDLLGTIKRLERESKHDLNTLLVTAATETQKTAVQNIQRGGRTGSIYQKYNPRRTHQASAKGEYPKSDTGDLARNITLENDGLLSYTVGSRKDAPHGYYLEMKSPNKGGRPWLSRAIKEVERKFEKMLTKAIFRK